MTLPESRTLHFLAFLTSAALLGAAFFFEYVMELEPCPLCMSQRVVFFLIGLTSLAAAIQNPAEAGRRRYGKAIAVIALLGAGLAIRQLYLQSLPADQVPACMPGLSYLVDVLPLVELLSVMLSGTGDCAEVQWVFLGLTIPGWTLVCFLCYGCFGLIETVRKHKIY